MRLYCKANSILNCLVAATKGCRKVHVLGETISHCGVAARVEDVHSGSKLFTNLAIRAMVWCGEHVIVDGLVVEMMQVGVHLGVASLAREALFLPSRVANHVGVALGNLDTLGVKASKSGIGGRECAAALRAMAIYNPLRRTDSFNLTRTAKARGLASSYCAGCRFVVHFIDRLVAAAKGCRKVSILGEAIDDVGIAARVEDVHAWSKLFTNLAIWAMVGCGEHIVVDGLVVEMMQVGVYLRVACLARQSLFLTSRVANQIGLAFRDLDTLRVKASKSGI